jgi:hypothetical protein
MVQGDRYGWIWGWYPEIPNANGIESSQTRVLRFDIVALSVRL